jgi:hypothetical protein
VRDCPQAEHNGEVRQVLKELGDPAIVGLEEGLQDQAGKELGLGVDLRTELVRVKRQGFGASREGLAGDTDRRFTSAHVLL